MTEEHVSVAGGGSVVNIGPRPAVAREKFNIGFVSYSLLSSHPKYSVTIGRERRVVKWPEAIHHTSSWADGPSPETSPDSPFGARGLARVQAGLPIGPRAKAT